MPFIPKTYSDEELLQSLKDGSLPPLDFTHEAHIRLVWIVNKQDPSNTFDMVSRIIENYATHIGEKDIYHHTLTYAAVKIVLHFKNSSKKNDFKEFIQENPCLLDDFKSLVSAHYSKKLLNSVEAKQKKLEPDLLPF